MDVIRPVEQLRRVRDEPERDRQLETRMYLAGTSECDREVIGPPLASLRPTFGRVQHHASYCAMLLLMQLAVLPTKLRHHLFVKYAHQLY